MTPHLFPRITALLQGATAQARTPSHAVLRGTTGGCTWELADTKNGYTLTIAGSGAMADYDYYARFDTPWFSHSSLIKTLVVGHGVTSIGSFAFAGCRSLTSVAISGTVTSIGEAAFIDCRGLSSIAIPSSVTSIGSGAFYSCCGLAHVAIPSSVTRIGDDAFENTRWQSNQPDGTIYINHVLYKYKGVMPAGTDVVVREGTVSIAGSAFFNCGGLTGVAIPDSVICIGNDAFFGCAGLTNLTIPNSVVSIGELAFAYCCGLTSVTIGSALVHIGQDAFLSCTKLAAINIAAENKTFTSDEGIVYHKGKTRLCICPEGKVGRVGSDK
jgi:hypothetical protein